MNDDMMFRIDTNDPQIKDLLTALGPVAPLVLAGHAYVVGGALARIACELKLGDDIDIVTDRHGDRDCAVRGALIDAGYGITSKPSATGGHIDYREKWTPPAAAADLGALAVDVLVLADSADATPGDDIYSRTQEFMHSFDAAVCQQILGMDDGRLALTQTEAAAAAVSVRRPGWIAGVETKNQARRDKWDRLLPLRTSADRGEHGPEYLGDGVYAKVEHGQIVLSAGTDIVYLELSTYDNLVYFVMRTGVRVRR